MMQLQTGGQTSTAQAAAAAAAGTTIEHVNIIFPPSHLPFCLFSLYSLPTSLLSPLFSLLIFTSQLSPHSHLISFLIVTTLLTHMTTAVASSVTSALCVKEIKVNCKGNRVAILAEHVEGALQVRHRDSQLYVFDHNKGASLYSLCFLSCYRMTLCCCIYP